MASNGRKPSTPVKATSAKPKPVAKTPAKAAAAPMAVVTKTVAKPAVAPVAVKAPVAPAPVAAKPVPPVAAKIELPAPVAAVEKTVEQVIEKVADTAVKTIEPVVEAIKPAIVEAPVAIIQKEVKTMEANLKNAAEKAQTLFAEANERAKAAVEKGTKLFEEANEFSKGNIEAIVESGKIAAKGIETLGQDAADYSRKQFEGATAALKSLSSIKSPTDFFKLQSDYVRSSFDSIVAQTSKNTEAMLKLAGEVAQPISNRVAVAVEKVKIAA
jgi:phasin family protein